MKHTFIFTILVIIAAAACKKNQEVQYRSDDNVYFDFSSSSARDSIIYTFAYDPTAEKDTVYLPVRISGIRVNHERKFGIMVLDSGTTAKSGTHYAPFQKTYTMPADSGIIRLPVIIYNTDPALTEKSVKLRLKLLPSEDLDTTINTLITAKIVFSNKLEQPAWWSMWLGAYYSQVKHRLFLITTGVTEMSTSGLDAPKNLYYVGKLNNLINDPFNWVIANADKGYEITQRTDGNYDFYNKESPSKTMLIKKNTSAGKFYFIDENGTEVH